MTWFFLVDIVLAQSTNTVSHQVNGSAHDLWDDKLVSRKRKRNTKLWKKNKRKRLLNSGQEYVSTSGRPVSAKHLLA